MEQSPDERIEELERLVSALRHDLRGIITPASLVAEGLRRNADPAVQRAAGRISDTIDRIVSRLNETCAVVPPSGRSGPVIGATGRTNTAAAIGGSRKA